MVNFGVYGYLKLRTYYVNKIYLFAVSQLKLFIGSFPLRLFMDECSIPIREETLQAYVFNNHSVKNLQSRRHFPCSQLCFGSLL